MQKDDDVGRIASVTPILISRALELFLRKLCGNVIDYAKRKKSRTLSPSHLKAYVYSDEMMDFLKAIVKDVPDLGPGDNAGTVLPAKRVRVLPGDGSTGQTKGRGREVSGCSSKRQCVPHSAPDVSTAASAFSQLTQRGPDGGTLATNTDWKFSSSSPSSSLRLSRSETHSMGETDKPGRFSSLPNMTSAVRVNETHVDPSTLPINLQKALHVPTEVKTTVASTINMPPVSTALSISDIELGVRPKDTETPVSVHDLSPTKQFLNLRMPPVVSAPQNAEEENYEFSDDDIDLNEQN